MNAGLVVHRAPHPSRKRRQWRDVPLARYVDEVGVDYVAEQLQVTPQAVQHWLTGRNAPRPMHAVRIVTISGGRLSAEDVYAGFTDLRKRRNLAPASTPSEHTP